MKPTLQTLSILLVGCSTSHLNGRSDGGVEISMDAWLESQTALDSRVDTSTDAVRVDRTAADTGPSVAGWRSQVGYVKATNPEQSDGFSRFVALSADGLSLAVSAPSEASCTTDQNDNSCVAAGAVYVYRRDSRDVAWVFDAYLKPPSIGPGDAIAALALSADGTTLVMGASGDDSCARGVTTIVGDNDCLQSGAAYVWTRPSSGWRLQAYLKASNAEARDGFGYAVALSDDGNTLAIGALKESSCATGVNGDSSNNDCPISGAAYVFARAGTTWSEVAYLKASNSEPGIPRGGVSFSDLGDYFGNTLDISADGATIAVGALYEASCSDGIGGDLANNACDRAGAVYMFAKTGSAWTHSAYLKSPASEPGDQFGSSVSLSSDGRLLAVGTPGLGTCFVGQTPCTPGDGGVHVFSRAGSTWMFQSTIMGALSRSYVYFGAQVSVSRDGQTLAIGAEYESTCGTGVVRDTSTMACDGSGTVHVYEPTALGWTLNIALKSTALHETIGGEGFGVAVALSADGRSLVAGASREGGCEAGTNADPNQIGCPYAGAVFSFERD